MMKKLTTNLPFIMLSCMLALSIYVIKKNTRTIKATPVKQPVNISKIVAPHVVPYKDAWSFYQRRATGFHISYKLNTYIMTNKHVCDSALAQGSKNIVFGEYVGKIIKVSTKHDLCLVTSNRIEGLTLAEENPVEFDDIYLVGFPRGMGKVIRKGHIIEDMVVNASGLKFADNNVRSTLISTTTYGGNSGSPVVNKYGEVIGVLFAGDKRFATEGLMVPLEFVKEFLNE